jgi:hypothetical protein
MVQFWSNYYTMQQSAQTDNAVPKRGCVDHTDTNNHSVLYIVCTAHNVIYFVPAYVIVT